MERAEYAVQAEVEKKHWWFSGLWLLRLLFLFEVRWLRHGGFPFGVSLWLTAKKCSSADL